MPSHFYLLDVGHGLCALIDDARSGYFVVDAGSGKEHLRSVLIHKRWLHINAAVLSHADKDHMGGLVSILDDPRSPELALDEKISVGRVFVNADYRPGANRDVLYNTLVKFEQENRDSLVDHAILARRDINPTGDLEIELLHPGGALTFRPPAPHTGLPFLEPHAQNAVVRIALRRKSPDESILLAGDLDAAGLDRLLQMPEAARLRCKVLVYPHHGGLAGKAVYGSANAAFARKLIENTSPKYVLFPNGRHSFDNPRQEVIDTIRSILGPEAIIQCSQMNKTCDGNTLYSCPATAEHIQPAVHGLLPFARTEQCAGNIHFVLDETIFPAVDPDLHRQYVKIAAPWARCATVTGPLDKTAGRVC